VFPPRARKGFPQASALRLCSPRALSAALQGWETPLPLQLLPPTFARRRSACMSHAAANSKATAKATAQGGSTHDGVEHKTFSIKADYIRKIDNSAPNEASAGKAAKPAKEGQ